MVFPPVLSSGKLSDLLWKYFPLMMQIIEFFVSYDFLLVNEFIIQVLNRSDNIETQFYFS